MRQAGRGDTSHPACLSCGALPTAFVLRNGRFAVGSAAGLVDANQRVYVQRDTPKLQSGVLPFGGENRVFCPGVTLKLVCWLPPVIGQAHAPRIEEEGGTQAANLLKMGVPAGHDGRRKSA